MHGFPREVLIKYPFLGVESPNSKLGEGIINMRSTRNPKKVSMWDWPMRIAGLQIIPYLPRAPLESSDLTHGLGILSTYSHPLLHTPETPPKYCDEQQFLMKGLELPKKSARKQENGEKGVRGRCSPNSSRGSTWPRAGNAAWSALTPGLLAGSLLNCSLLTMLPISPCFPSHHASHLFMLPISPWFPSCHASHLTMFPISPCLTVPISPKIWCEVTMISSWTSGWPSFLSEWALLRRAPFLARSSDLKGIFGMKAFCQETRQDSGHSQAAKRARQGSSWTATRQK